MPKCECHGVEKIWHKNKTMKAGGHWRCKVLHYEAHKRYNKSKKGKARDHKYNVSAKGWWRNRDFYLKNARAEVLTKLEELRKCQIS